MDKKQFIKNYKENVRKDAKSLNLAYYGEFYGNEFDREDFDYLLYPNYICINEFTDEEIWENFYYGDIMEIDRRYGLANNEVFRVFFNFETKTWWCEMYDHGTTFELGNVDEAREFIRESIE